MAINLLGNLANTIKTGFNQPQYYQGMGIKSKANPMGSNIQTGGMSKVPTVGMDTPNGSTQVPVASVGIRAKSPVANVTPPPTTIPNSQQSPVQPAPVQNPPTQPYSGYTGNVPQDGSTGNTGNTQVTYPGLLGKLVSQSGAGLGADQANEAFKNAQALNAELAKSKKNEADTLANIGKEAIPLNFQQGRQQVAQTQYEQQQAALGTQLQGESNLAGLGVTGQGQQLGALGTAVGATAPVMQAGMLTNPQTGQPLNPGVVGNAVNQAAQLIQNGADPNDPQIQSLLAPFGYYGQSALVQALQGAGNGSYNPTVASGIAQQNVSQGKTYQGIAQELSNALQPMKLLGDKLTNFIQATGQNPATAPLVNEQIAQVNAQLYPAQVATLNSAVNDIRSYAIQVLGSQSGANPTDVTNSVNSFDFSKFSAQDLSDFLGDLQNMGTTRLSQAQSAMKAGYGGNTIGAPAAGITANDQGQFNTGNMTPSSMKSNLGKALLGTLFSAAGGAGNVLGGAANSAVRGAAGGAGAAEVLFGG